MSGKIRPSKNKREKTLEHRHSYHSIEAVELEMKRVRKEQVQSIESITKTHQYEVTGAAFPARKTWYIFKSERFLCGWNKGIRVIIEAAFHIEQMSQNWYKDPADRVKKLSRLRV